MLLTSRGMIISVAENECVQTRRKLYFHSKSGVVVDSVLLRHSTVCNNRGIETGVLRGLRSGGSVAQKSEVPQACR